MKEVMIIKELSELIGISESKIYKMVSENKIPYIKIGRQIRFTREMIFKYLEEKRVDIKKGL